MFTGPFPKDLRVLVFDEDPEYSLKLVKYLQAFQYNVTKCLEEKKAMELLRDQKSMIDIAIIDVQNSNDDRFRSISEIISQRALPIIVTSENDSVESITNWIWSGACDYLTKPIRPEELRCIFKHVLKKKRVTSNRVALASALETEEKVITSAEKSHSNKKKREEENGYNVRDFTTKKRRVVWDDELHQKFIEAVEYLGVENAVPKKILERMMVAGISREHVASHLQKYRITLKKENDKQRKENNNNLTQLPTNPINNNIRRQFSHMQQWQPNTYPNEFILPQQRHHDVDPVVVTPNQHDHRNSDFPFTKDDDGSLVYKNSFVVDDDDDDGVENLTRYFAQNSEHEMSLLSEDQTTTMIPSLGNNPPTHMLGFGNENVEPRDSHLPQTVLVSDGFSTGPVVDQKQNNEEEGGDEWIQKFVLEDEVSESGFFYSFKQQNNEKDGRKWRHQLHR
ncbi:unnamed protein product [Cochlearia groenlandica]